MPKLLQINVTANWGSTGKIAEQIGLCAQTHGWESYIAYGRNFTPSKNKLIKIGSMLDVYEHFIESRFFDNEGLASRRATKEFLKEIDAIKPDIIHLHNIHDHYLNFRILFDFLSKKNIPIVWTIHDQWATTGHCGVCVNGCERWKNGCYGCPSVSRFCIDRSKRNYGQKKSLFTSLKNMTIVPVSEWLGIQIKQSFFKNYPIEVIKNGVDVVQFKPMESNVASKYDLEGKHVLLGVSSVWPKFKGMDDFIKLSKLLPYDFRIVLVGLRKEQINQLPSGIVGLERTDSQVELAQLYSIADIVLSLSSFETFGLTIAEGMACGTPAIVYDNAALPELITENTGRVVKRGNIQDLFKTIMEMTDSNFKRMHSSECRKYAEDSFDKNRTLELYISLYNRMLMGGV